MHPRELRKPSFRVENVWVQEYIFCRMQTVGLIANSSSPGDLSASYLAAAWRSHTE